MTEQPRHTPGPWEANGAEVGPADSIMVVARVTNYEHRRETNARLIAAAPEMHEVLTVAARTFRQYEALHLAKGTEDGRLKAHANAEMAQRCEAVLAKAEALPTPAEETGA